jgi:hypothetical protein
MMSYIKLVAMLFMIMFVFAGCDDDKDKDKAPAHEVSACEPACAENEECKCIKNDEDVEVCGCEVKEALPADECKDKKENDECGENKICDAGLHCVDVKALEECFCDDEKQVVCPENDKEKCVMSEPECHLICKDGFVCKCNDNDGKVECKCMVDRSDEACKCDDGTACPENDKEKCVKAEESKCEPACNENQDCVCTQDDPTSVCVCKDRNVEDPSDPECNEEKPCVDENKECKENKCVDKVPVEENPEQ